MTDLTDELNTYLADLNIAAMNVRNMHWNAVGPYFTALHLATEKIYKEISCQIDEVAEIMKMMNLQPLARLSDYIDASTIDELDSNEFNEYDIIDNLVENGKELAKQAMEIRKKAEKDDNFLIVNKFEEYLCCYTKMEWMIRAMHIDENRPYNEDNED